MLMTWDFGKRFFSSRKNAQSPPSKPMVACSTCYMKYRDDKKKWGVLESKILEHYKAHDDSSHQKALQQMLDKKNKGNLQQWNQEVNAFYYLGSDGLPTLQRQNREAVTNSGKSKRLKAVETVARRDSSSSQTSGTYETGTEDVEENEPTLLFSRSNTHSNPMEFSDYSRTSTVSGINSTMSQSVSSMSIQEELNRLYSKRATPMHSNYFEILRHFFGVFVEPVPKEEVKQLSHDIFSTFFSFPFIKKLCENFIKKQCSKHEEKGMSEEDAMSQVYENAYRLLTRIMKTLGNHDSNMRDKKAYIKDIVKKVKYLFGDSLQKMYANDKNKRFNVMQECLKNLSTSIHYGFEKQFGRRYQLQQAVAVDIGTFTMAYMFCYSKVPNQRSVEEYFEHAMICLDECLGNYPAAVYLKMFLSSINYGPFIEFYKYYLDYKQLCDKLKCNAHITKEDYEELNTLSDNIARTFINEDGNKAIDIHPPEMRKQLFEAWEEHVKSRQTSGNSSEFGICKKELLCPLDLFDDVSVYVYGVLSKKAWLKYQCTMKNIIFIRERPLMGMPFHGNLEDRVMSHQLPQQVLRPAFDLPTLRMDRPVLRDSD